ncbi:DUF2085 domain-containing protein [Natronobacterium texcoconense]|uniref:Uncharacterized membrane protein n=1 Tax=Natronobacterium texcoconense TaxID=1095778 RepID=A0A1H1ANW2_NATTX|nr:DUF2085 domain-containing protein [Natronobacterium texcoconense]SDQ41453.1 Uncharacterized membrane protein [Natronobacterium texcoconense]
MRVDRSEIRDGLAATWPFLLSHHLPSEWYRCYSPHVFGRQVHICARCLGVYPGIAVGLATYFVAFPSTASVVLTAVLPLPALVDWTLTTFTDRRGYNVVRTVTGGLLGFAYGIGLLAVLLEFDLRIIVVGIAYAIIASVLIYFDQNGK